MPKAPLLNAGEIAAGLESLHGWVLEDGRLVKRFTLKDFRAAADFVGKIVGPADEQNHHPDVAIHWNELTFILWTHASGGITARDLRLAKTIDELDG
jgi:4a-hydroxytetrahydrobiopterin dehydratase